MHPVMDIFQPKRKSRLAIALISSMFALTAHATHSNSNSNLVTTQSGPVVGVTTSYGAEYLGIPYAAPPVGDLRWQAPQPVTPWTSPRDASIPGPGCPQAFSPFGQPSLSEDCLFLNVHTPDSKRFFPRKKPVMVWIHGGAFSYGEGHTYNPARLVEEDVIVVTINYRLGALGFLAHPALSATSPSGTSGNYGIMDQQAALKWVKNNIAAFGGDPDKVTIFGQSAGGLSVHSHLASPESKGLFHRAIIQSGAYLLEQPTSQVWEYVGLGIAAAMGCPDQSPACLRSLNVADILANQDPGALGYVPIVDGNVLPQSVLSALSTGTFNKVPVMEGTTRDEYSMFVALSFDLTGNPITPATYLPSMGVLGFPPEAAAFIAAQYPLENYATPGEAFTALGTDFLFACNSQTSIKLLSQQVPTYAYEFNDADAPFTTLPPVSFPYKAAHTVDIQYVLDSTTAIPSVLNDEQQLLSKFMVNYWTSFAKYGTPNLTFAPLWVRYGSHELMKSLEPAIPKTLNNFNEVHQCDFWSFLQSLQ